MTLQDHFRPPLGVWRHWHSFHNGWAYNIAADLNRSLPQGWFAEPNVQFGVEVDVATLEERGRYGETQPGTPVEGNYLPPAPVKTIPWAPVTERAEVAIYDGSAGPVLAAAIELVSPANKDRQASREAFVAKCDTFLRQGIGVMIIDIVTNRGGNLHTELLARVHETSHLNTNLYAVSYHPVEVDGSDQLDIWEEPLEIGRALPTMPLWLRGNLCFPVDLDASYRQTCIEQRIPVNGS